MIKAINGATKFTSSTDFSIIALKEFIQATRDSGYKSTPNAVCELVDNSIQAGAREVRIEVVMSQDTNPNHPIALSVSDNGCGMDHDELRSALRFGGSSRFNDRSGMGRYGMGLPNASLSQSREVIVYTWQSGKSPLMSYLNVDDIASGRTTEVPAPVQGSHPTWTNGYGSESGTIVVWSACDRLDNKRISTICRKIEIQIAQVFRYQIWGGLKILINEMPIKPFDPLFIQRADDAWRADSFEEPITLEFRSRQNPQDIGEVTVTFSELPVEDLHCLSHKEKRDLGISKSAGVSVVRNGREIDYGWYFMGSKRKENYDDWWRCEVKFEPCLDDIFGITHTKQQIRPSEDLLGALVPQMELVARVLNSRVRSRHHRLAQKNATRSASFTATEQEKFLKFQIHTCRNSAKISGTKETEDRSRKDSMMEFQLMEEHESASHFLKTLPDSSRIVTVLNRAHRFHKDLYEVARKSNSQTFMDRFNLFLMSLSRAETSFEDPTERVVIEEFLSRWGEIYSLYSSGHSKG